jgi:hypothetical protein
MRKSMLLVAIAMGMMTPIGCLVDSVMPGSRVSITMTLPTEFRETGRTLSKTAQLGEDRLLLLVEVLPDAAETLLAFEYRVGAEENLPDRIEMTLEDIPAGPNCRFEAYVQFRTAGGILEYGTESPIYVDLPEGATTPVHLTLTRAGGFMKRLYL